MTKKDTYHNYPTYDDTRHNVLTYVNIIRYCCVGVVARNNYNSMWQALLIPLGNSYTAGHSTRQ